MCLIRAACHEKICVRSKKVKLDLVISVCGALFWRFQVRTITAGVSGALGSNNKKTKSISPRLVYSAGPLSLGLCRKDGPSTHWGGKTLEDKRMLIGAFFWGLGEMKVLHS